MQCFMRNEDERLIDVEIVYRFATTSARGNQFHSSSTGEVSQLHVAQTGGRIQYTQSFLHRVGRTWLRIIFYYRLHLIS